MKVENFQTPFTFAYLLHHVVEIWPQKTQKSKIWQIWVIFSQNILYTSKSYFSNCKNVKIFQKKKHCLGLLEDVFKI
jgi:hypothetical protein